ncbi:hypothetical protein [Streptomyces sp. NPDC090445]|uniref:hypothetical protein n=1 Tax=Streptomyces sp. NPDC090445 TaxID=3365963 RepID=UPI003800AFE8
MAAALTVATAGQAVATTGTDPAPAPAPTVVFNNGNGNVFNSGNENINSAAGGNSQVTTGHASGGSTQTPQPVGAQLSTSVVQATRNVVSTAGQVETLNVSCPQGWQAVSGTITFTPPTPQPSHPEYLVGSFQLNPGTWQFNYRIPADAPLPVFVAASVVCAQVAAP